MSLSHAILGILFKEPMTGYDLKIRCFDDSISHFWPADQAQIYRTLDRLADEGMVESEVEIQEDRPNRKVYRITDEGRDELRDWLLTPQALPVYREPLLVQLFFADQLNNDQIVTLLRGQIEAHQERLARYGEIPLPPIGHPASTRKWALQRLTLDLGIRIAETYGAWLEMAIEVIENERWTSESSIE